MLSANTKNPDGADGDRERRVINVLWVFRDWSQSAVGIDTWANWKEATLLRHFAASRLSARALGRALARSSVRCESPLLARVCGVLGKGGVNLFGPWQAWEPVQGRPRHAGYAGDQRNALRHLKGMCAQAWLGARGSPPLCSPRRVENEILRLAALGLSHCPSCSVRPS